MRIRYFFALLLVMQFALLPSVGSADTLSLDCSYAGNTPTCTDGDGAFVQIEQYLGLVTNLDDINDCATQLRPSPTNPNPPLSCDTSTFTCGLKNGSDVSCDIKGVDPTIFNINCSTITDATATCNIDNNIASLLTKLVTNVDGNLASQLTSSQIAYASTLINVCSRLTNDVSPSLQRDCAVVINLIAATDTTDAAELLAEITPDAASAALDALQTTLRAQNQNIAQRINQLRSGAKEKDKEKTDDEQVSFNGLRFLSNGKRVEVSDIYPELRGYPDLVGTGGGASADQPRGRLGYFLNGTVEKGEKESSDNETGLTFSGTEITTGVDYSAGNDRFVGMAFGLSNNGSDLNSNRGTLDNSAFSFILYGSYFPDASTYFDANVIIGGSHFEQDRTVKHAITNIDQVMSAKYFGNLFSASLSAGHDFSRGSLTVSPYGRLQYVDSSTDDYNEVASDINGNGAGFALAIDEQKYQSMTFALGSQLTYAVSMDWGVFVPQAKLEWIREFKDDINIVSGNFIGDPQAEKFRIPTDKPDDSYFQLGLGGSVIVPGGSTMYVFYQKYIGFEYLKQYSINLGMRWEF